MSLSSSTPVYADGGGPPECDDTPTATGDDDLVEVNASAGHVIAGVCIKAGQLHTGLITEDGTVDGATDPDCYEISGIGTSLVTVTRLGSGSGCQEISHVDYVEEEARVELEVEKDAETSFIRECEWAVEKKVVGDDHFELDPPGGTFTASYKVIVSVECIDRDFDVTGEITVSNIGSVPTTVDDVSDALNDGTVADVECGAGVLPATLDPGDSITCTYEALDVDAEAVNENTATATTDEGDKFSGSAAVIWGDPSEVIDGCVDVEDDLHGSLGTVCHDDPPADFKFTYEIEHEAECGEQEFVNTASIHRSDDGELDSDTATVISTVDCPVELEVEKEAETSFIRTCDWDIEKNVVGDDHFVLPIGGGAFTASYQVIVTLLGCEDSDFDVTGTITVTNVGFVEAVVDDVSDVLNDGTIADVDCGAGVLPATLDPGDSISCTYEALDVDPEAVNENTATATTDEGDAFSGSAAVIWGEEPDEIVDGCVKVVDSLAGNLGQICHDDDPEDFEFTYDIEHQAECGEQEFENVASVIGKTTGDVLATDSATVTSEADCFEGCTPGFWKNHVDIWTSPGPPNVAPGIDPGDLMSALLGFDAEVPAQGRHDSVKLSDLTIEEALDLPGGGLRALVRHAAAALLNADSGLAYPFSTAVIQAMVEAAFGSGNPEPALGDLEAANELGCGWDAHGRRIEQ